MSNKFIKKPYSNQIDGDYITYLFDSKDLFDIVLVLKDGMDLCSLNLHRIFLHRIPYFDMLIRNMKDNILEVNVPHIEITKKIIARCYNIPIKLDDAEKLWYVKCCSFMCIECDVEILADLKVDAENYELLCSIASEFEYSDLFIELLVKNYPEDYELSRLPKRALKEMRKIYTISPLSIFSEVDRQTTNTPTPDINLSPNIEKYPYRFIYPPNINNIGSHQKIVISHDNTMAAFYDNELVKFSCDDEYLLIRTSPFHMIIRDVISNNIIKEVKLDEEIKDFIQLHENVYTITVDKSGQIYIVKINLADNVATRFATKRVCEGHVEIYICSNNKLIIRNNSMFSLIYIKNNGTCEIESERHFPNDNGIISIISDDGSFFVVYSKGTNKLYIYRICTYIDLVDICNISVKFPALIYFSNNVMFQNNDGIYHVNGRELDESEIGYHNFPSKLTDRIDDILN